MKLKQLKLTNFLSVESATIDFPDNGLILVEGWNQDDNSANGAGKTTIFDGLSYCLFGNVSKSISPTELIRNGAKQFRVDATFSRMGSELICSRGRNGSTRLSIFTRDGEEISEQEFHKIIGITEDQFNLVQYFSQGNSGRFLDLSDSQKKELILKLVNADAFSEIKDRVDKDIKIVAKNKDLIQSEIDQLKSKLSVYQETLEDSSLIEKDITDKQGVRLKTLSKIKELEKKERPDTSKYDEAIASLQVHLDCIKELEWTSNNLRKQLKTIKDSPTTSSKDPDHSCPVCSSDLDLIDNKLTKHDHDSLSQKVNAAEAERKAKISSISEQINDIEKMATKKEELELTISKLNDKIRDMLFDYKNADNRIKELKAFLKQMDFSISELQDKLNKNQNIKNKIEELSSSIDDKNGNLIDIISKHSKLSGLSQVLSPTGVQAYILDSVLDNLNIKIRDNLAVMWPNVNFEIVSFKENKSGTVSAKMGEILEIGGIKKSLGSLSGGERKALSLAIDMALIETVSNYMGLSIDPVILDESFDGMDASNRGRVISLLQDMSLKRLIFVVDHSAEAKSLFDQTLSVVKKNGISSISW